VIRRFDAMPVEVGTLMRILSPKFFDGIVVVHFHRVDQGIGFAGSFSADSYDPTSTPGPTFDVPIYSPVLSPRSLAATQRADTPSHVRCETCIMVHPVAVMSHHKQLFPFFPHKRTVATSLPS